VFARLAVGSCLANADPGIFHVIPCAGPHTDEVTLSEDLTTRFPTTPTIDQILALSNELCPAAGRAGTSGDKPDYTTGYLWQFDNGVPGQVLRASCAPWNSPAKTPSSARSKAPQVSD
jgi:hypothetical protein